LDAMRTGDDAHLHALSLRLRQRLGLRRFARRRLAGRCRRLGALLRLGLGRLAILRLGREPGIAEEALHPLARQVADLQPMLDALGLQHDALGMPLVEHRVVGAELLDEAAVARAVRIRNDDAVEGPLLGPAAGQTDLECHESPFTQELAAKLSFAPSSRSSAEAA